MNQEQIYDLFENVLKKYLGEEMKTNDELCVKVWSSLANVDWYYIRDTSALHMVSYSFRAAGRLIAEIRESGNYMDWYCSGPDATVDGEVRRALRKEGFIPDVYPEICDESGCMNDVSVVFRDEDGKTRITCFVHSKLGKS